MESKIWVELERVDRIYRPGDTVEGSIYVYANSNWSHKGIVAKLSGSVCTRPAGADSAGLGILGIGSQCESTQIFSEEKLIQPQGSVLKGESSVYFQFKLRDSGILLDTYHGVYISVLYHISINCERSLTKRPLSAHYELVVEVKTCAIVRITYSFLLSLQRFSTLTLIHTFAH